MSGVINVITKPTHYESDVTAGVETGSFGTAGMDLGAEGSQGQFGYKLSGAFLRVGDQVEADSFSTSTLSAASDYIRSSDSTMSWTARWIQFDGSSFPENGGGPELSILRIPKTSNSGNFLAGFLFQHQFSKVWGAGIDIDVFTRGEHSYTPPILVPSSDGNRGFSYTMERMAEFLEIEPPRMRVYVRSSSPSPRAITGHRALAQHRFEDFMKLRDLRGGFVEGTRNNAALIFASILRGNRLEESTIAAELTKFGRECKPPLTSQEVENILRSKRTYRKMRDQVIATRLRVTEEEAIVVPRWGYGFRLPCAGPVETSPAERREMILKLASESGRWPPCREMAATLRQQGVQVGHATVNRDYQFLRPRFPLLPFELERDA